jgi:hypothetical protein
VALYLQDCTASIGGSYISNLSGLNTANALTIAGTNFNSTVSLAGGTLTSGSSTPVMVTAPSNPTLQVYDPSTLSTTESPRLVLSGATGSAFWIDNTGTRLRISAGAAPNSVALSTTVDNVGNVYAPIGIFSTGAQVGSTLDRIAAGTLSIGTATANAITIGAAAIPTTVAGTLTVSGGDAFTESTTGDFVHKIVRSGTTLLTISNVSTGAAIINSNNGAALEFGASSSTQRNTNQFQITSTNVKSNSGFATTRTAVTYSASMTADASTGNTFVITATDGTAFAINAPTNVTSGQRITFTVRNTSGGVLGVVTWNAVFKMATWTQPANGNSRSIDFVYDGTNWVEVARTPSDIPN